MSAPTVSTIEISKDYLHFNAAHFTLFSASEREDLHGHTFYVTAEVDSPVGEDGLAFDYNLFKSALEDLCSELDEKVLLPERSPYLTLEHSEGYLIARFADERIPFLPRDVLTLPVRNITVEELAGWFLERVRTQPAIAALDLIRVQIRVSSGPGQWAGAQWHNQGAQG
ncbi:MAG: 6-carboxytetrahydropterin synthase [Gammaproteobacteria bacterium]|nr:6-carboxytetrahydropterin synthase [Gammaproteobacteria bacterium]